MKFLKCYFRLFLLVKGRVLLLVVPVRELGLVHTGVWMGSIIFLVLASLGRTYAESPLQSVCNSDPASIRAMLDDPLLADFFEMTCGSKATEAARSSQRLPSVAKGVPTFKEPVPANQNRAREPAEAAGAYPTEAIRPAIDVSVIEQPSPELASGKQQVGTAAVFTKFRLEGNLVIDKQSIARALEPLVGEPITRNRLGQLTQLLARAYRDEGWLVTIHLPDQDVSEGTVAVQIKEAVFQGASISDPQGVLRNTSLPKATVEEAQPVGQAVNLEKIKEAQARLNDLPGVVAQLNLTKGSEAQSTEAIVQVSDNAARTVSLSADNSGSRSTGQERFLVGLTLNNPSYRGDQLVAQLLASEGLRYGSLEYSIPLGPRMWRYGLRLSSMNYELVSPDFAGLDAKGPTHSAGVFVQMPIIRNPKTRIQLNANLTTNRFKNELSSETYSRYKSDVLSMGWATNTMNLLFGSSQTSSDIQLSRGRLDLSDSTESHRLIDRETLQTEGWFSKVRLGLAHRQYLTAKTSVFASIRGQWSDENLDGSERFSLGGSGGVRAYPTSEASGSIGGVATLELQHREQLRRGNISLAAFYDYGEIKRNTHNNFESASDLNRYNLKGYGLWLGTEYAMTDGFLGLRLTWARRDGENAGRSEITGFDQDGTLDKDRFWFDAYLRY